MSEHSSCAEFDLQRHSELFVPSFLRAALGSSLVVCEGSDFSFALPLPSFVAALLLLGSVLGNFRYFC